MNRRYAAALAVAAAVVLAVGIALGPRPRARTPQAPAPAPQPSQQSRRGQMRQISEFLNERAHDLASHVAYLHSTGTSAVLWSSGEMVTSASPPAYFRTAAVPTGASPEPAALAPPERFDQAGWVVLTARNAEGQVLSASGMSGGSTSAQCGSVSVRKLIFNVPLDATLAGAGVFDLSGGLLGVVTRCGDSWMALGHDTVQRLLEQQLGADAVAWQDFGVRTAAAGEAERTRLRVPQSGLFVTEVRRSSRAHQIGVWPGDVLLRSDDDPLERPEDLLALGDTLTVLREGRQSKLPTAPAFTVEPAAPAPLLTSVQPGSRLYEAGLRPGDRIHSPRGVPLTRMLSRSGQQWLVYEREDRLIGVLLP